MKNLSPGAQSLVNAGKEALKPSAADQERILATLHARLGDSVVAGEAASAGTVSSSWPVIAAVTAAIGVGGALFFGLGDRDEPTAAPPPAAAHAPAPAAVSTAPVQPVTESAPAAPAEPAAAEQPSPSARRSGTLAQEVAMLSRATADLQAGRAAEALKVLAEHQRKFPGGLLAEERRAARVQALCALGRRAEAEAELERLERTSPQSPQTARARQFCSAQR